MIGLRRRVLALVGTAVLTAATVGVGPATRATAQPRVLAAQGTPFGSAGFAAYGTGSELELSALRGVASTLADVDQAFSGITAAGPASNLLNSAVTSPYTGSVVQPAISGTVNATARGSGLEVGLGVVPTQPDAIQLGLAQVHAPSSFQTQGSLLGPAVSAVPLVLPGIITTGVLHGFATTSYNPDFCPVGGPIAMGLGGAAAPTSVLGGTVGAPGAATSATRTDLIANADGTFGLETTVAESIAPLVVNLGGLATLTITIQGTSPQTPITLTSYTDGEGHSSTFLGGADPTVSVTIASPTLPLLRVGPITASLKGIAALVNPLLDTGGTISALLSSLAGVDLTLHIGNGTTVVTPLKGLTNGANTTSGSYDLLALDLGLGPVATETHIVNLKLGHMEAAASLPNGSIQCTVPIAKSANPTVVQAGSNFTWSISIPSSSTALSDSSCDLVNIRATDKFSVNSGSPTFTIGAISNGGVFNTATSTITWPNLGTYHPGDPPIVVTIQVSVPSGSAAGVLADTANALANLGNCTGGATGVATLIGPNVSNVVIGGSITILQPSITAVGAGLATTGRGPLLPWIAAALLLMAYATYRMLRRARPTR